MQSRRSLTEREKGKQKRRKKKKESDSAVRGKPCGKARVRHTMKPFEKEKKRRSS